MLRRVKASFLDEKPGPKLRRARGVEARRLRGNRGPRALSNARATARW
jgi:hypothetical protein